jgi:hypothetical protein
MGFMTSDQQLILIGRPDAMCLEALKRGLVRVDVGAGRAWLQRFAGKEAGTKNGKGYIVFTLHVDGQRAQIKMHRLIWLAAHGCIPDGLMPDHRNRIKSDNRIANLLLVDAKGNSENRRSYVGESNPAARLTRDRAIEIRFATGSYAAKALRFGVSKSLVAQISRGELWP